MKRNRFVFPGMAVLILLSVLILAGCGGGKYPLNGVWSGSFQGDNILMVFANDICFVGSSTEIEDKCTFTYDGKGTGVLIDSGRDTMPFTVKNNVLTMSMYGITLSLTKDTKAKAADNKINGIWKGPSTWLMAFVNDKICLVDDDNDYDIGTFTFSGSSGKFKTEDYGYEVEFTVNGNAITAVFNLWGYTDTVVFAKQQ